MNKQINKFVELASQASREDIPRVDVRNRILASISVSTVSAYPDLIAFRFLIGSMSLALAALVMVSLFASQEPPLEMISPFVSSLP